jgi:hypothetical protein
MRVPQPGPDESRGSQHWIQWIINNCPEKLNTLIQEKIVTLSGRKIEWVSPRQNDEFAEYRDAAFLKQINLQELTGKLQAFWPTKGPQWDAFGMTSDQKAYILLEAKANVPELVSFCAAKDQNSIRKISASLAATQDWLNCREPRMDWKKGFYQHANRLAHLYFLSEEGSKEAYLVFLYFMDDYTHIRTSREKWEAALKLQKKLMGLTAKILAGKAIDIFIDVKDISSAMSA